MHKLLNYFFANLLSIFLASAVKIPSEITLCHKSDPAFDDCVAKSMEKAVRLFKNGNKELGIPPLDPFYIPRVEIGVGSGTAVQLNQVYTNMSSHGISDSKFTDAKYEFTNGKCHWSFYAFTPQVQLKSHYQLEGKILVFPLNGHGKCTITLINVRNHHQGYCKRYQKNGKTYLNFYNYTQNTVPENVVLDFENVVPGNPELSKTILDAVNENVEQIFAEIRPSLEYIWSTFAQKDVNSFFSRVPENEAFLD